MTSSWPAATTQTRVRANLAMHPKVFSHQMPFLAHPPYFQAAYPEARLNTYNKQNKFLIKYGQYKFCQKHTFYMN